MSRISVSAYHRERAAVKRRTSASTREAPPNLSPPKAPLLSLVLAKPEPTPGTYAASVVPSVPVSPIARANESRNADVMRSRTDVDVSERALESFSATGEETRSERSERDARLDDDSAC